MTNDNFYNVDDLTITRDEKVEDVSTKIAENLKASEDIQDEADNRYHTMPGENLDKALKSLHKSKVFAFSSYESDFFTDTITWQGYIDKISDDNKTFSAVLNELGCNSSKEVAEFDIEDVSSDDISLVRIGAIFFYSIGYRSYRGQKTKQGILKFKRNIKFTEDDVDIYAAQAHEIVNSINWE